MLVRVSVLLPPHDDRFDDFTERPHPHVADQPVAVGDDGSGSTLEVSVGVVVLVAVG